VDTKITRIKELVTILNEARKVYEQEDRELMSNFDYDKLYDELVDLERQTGFELAYSPTKQVGYELLTELPKEAHSERMLSLDKTKEIEALTEFLKDKEGLLSWKLDGLTLVLTYINGILVKAVTRGNGDVGEVVTNNAKVFRNIPLKIHHQGEVIIRGEAVIKYSDFIKINDKIELEEEKYKNPRNLCSGSVRQLNNEITAKRNVNFFAFQLVKADGLDELTTKEDQFIWLKNQGFEVVEYVLVNGQNIADSVKDFSEKIKNNDIASDGLVLTYNDLIFSSSLGKTSKFPKHSIAFKWVDEQRETTLNYIEWSTSRTGTINPIAVFEPVELEGTTVSRASLHNLSILEDLELGKGDTITVYKANMIIPQIADNLTRSGVDKYPHECPSCGGETDIRQDTEVKLLFCTNDFCQAKIVKAFAHFVSRDAMNIEGLSEATLEKFIDEEYIKELDDIYKISQYNDKIIVLKGFGQKSYDKLIKSIEKSRKVKLSNFIYSLGIQNVGLSNAKLLCKYFNNNLINIRKATRNELLLIQGFGEIIANTIYHYFSIEKNNIMVDNLLKEVDIETETVDEDSQILKDQVFVITGSLLNYENRNALKDHIESLGGKVTGAISSSTTYLINNDITSNSSKNKKAKELGVKIISEDTFSNMLTTLSE
jgi:DNA ligase (NAD+)